MTTGVQRTVDPMNPEEPDNRWEWHEVIGFGQSGGVMYDPRCGCNRSSIQGCEIHEECDQWCGALKDPETLDEYRVALDHWRSHELLGGCAHGH